MSTLRKHPSSVAAPSVGRPRSQQAHQAILQAAGDLLERNGFAAVTMKAIAARAGVSKATIYRRWPNKAAIITEGFLEQIAPKIKFMEAGSVQESVRLQMHLLAKLFAGKRGRVIAALVGEAQNDATVSRAFLKHWIAVRRHDTRQVLALGIARGELRPDLDLDVAMDALYGPIYYRLLVRHLPLSEAFVDKLAEHVLHGIAHSP